MKHKRRVWNEEEKKFLWELHTTKMDDGKKLPHALVVHFFNERYKKRTRSSKSIEYMLGKMTKVEAIKKVKVTPDMEKTVAELTKSIEEKPKKKKDMRGKGDRRQFNTKNARKAWNYPGDKYLVMNWDASDDNRKKVAKHLGRTIQSCRNRLSKIKKQPDYYHKLLGMDTSTHSVVIDHGTSAISQPKVDNGGGLLERLLRWVVHRRQTKEQRKIAKIERKLQKLRGI
tara:strand:+ start:746 stop:1429 length:684 start_codon:yes stop_codon:yes gene_type:complete